MREYYYQLTVICKRCVIVRILLSIITFRENFVGVPWPHSVCYSKIVQVHPFVHISGQPFTAYPRQLPTEKLKAVKSAFEEMLQLGDAHP